MGILIEKRSRRRVFPSVANSSASWLAGYFQDQDVYCVATGHSVKGFDLSRLQDKNVIAVNHAFRFVKTDILCFLDHRFKGEVHDLGIEFYDLPFKILAGPSGGLAQNGNVTVVRMSPKPSRTPDALYGRPQSGLLGINAAIVSGASRIFLLGYDCRHSGGGEHFYTSDVLHPDAQYRRIAKAYNPFSVFKNIYNCNNKSFIKAFPFVDINDILED